MAHLAPIFTICFRPPEPRRNLRRDRSLQPVRRFRTNAYFQPNTARANNDTKGTRQKCCLFEPRCHRFPVRHTTSTFTNSSSLVFDADLCFFPFGTVVRISPVFALVWCGLAPLHSAKIHARATAARSSPATQFGEPGELRTRAPNFGKVGHARRARQELV